MAAACKVYLMHVSHYLVYVPALTHVYSCVHMYGRTACILKSGDSFKGSGFFPSTPEVPEIKLKSTDVVASFITHRVISLALQVHCTCSTNSLRRR